MAGESAPRFVVVDTNAFILLTRRRTKGEQLARYVEGRRIVLSFVTVAELRRGAYARGYVEASWPRMEDDIASAVVVPPTDALSMEWARLSNDARARGYALGQRGQAHDAWIAATGRQYEIPILTEDRNFDGYPGLELFPERS